MVGAKKSQSRIGRRRNVEPIKRQDSVLAVFQTRCLSQVLAPDEFQPLIKSLFTSLRSLHSAQTVRPQHHFMVMLLENLRTQPVLNSHQALLLQRRIAHKTPIFAKWSMLGEMTPSTPSHPSSVRKSSTTMNSTFFGFGDCPRAISVERTDEASVVHRSAFIGAMFDQMTISAKDWHRRFECAREAAVIVWQPRPDELSQDSLSPTGRY
jgi:hypothetical protein